jgi:cellulose synthase/poly-beta-1,6-N-acetylglucosamine synthase-like glycosyltransferase
VTPLLAALFAVPLAGLAATYLLYPLFVLLLARRAEAAAPAAVPPSEKLPFVSFVIAAYNEEDAITKKLQNTLELDYPADRLEVIVASDGSSDGTDALVESFPDERVRLVRNDARGGKTATTALAVEQAQGGLLVFSDATGLYNREALRELVAPFADSEVGAVSGRVIYEYDDSQTARGFRLYQSWVTAQRRAEPSLHTLTSVSGSIHALSREIFEPVPAHLSYDMVVPALVAMHDKRVVYAPGATSGEVSRRRAGEEFAARVRIAVRAYAFLGWLFRERARIHDRGYLAQLFFHKVLRWFSAQQLLLLLAAHVLLALATGGWAATLLVPHLGIYGVAALLARFEGSLRFPGRAVLLLFATVNAAYAVGFVRWLRGARLATWSPDR